MASTGGKLDFKGRVVVVTGAGNGLGRQYALAFARNGASVVINDLGVDRHGNRSSLTPADLVVKEIVDGIGGKAVANYDSVEEGEKIVDTALKAFGRVDIVVNNAGILRDKSFLNMSVEDWDIIQRIHLRGSFLVSKAAWPHMKKQGYGRIIMTSSAAGIYGNYGQANYSAAKLGLLGLSNTLAIEGAKYNIHCNTIAPIAGSRLTETVMPPDLVEQLKPEYVAPLVVYLCHDSCNENGALFEVGAGWVTKLRWEGTQGSVVRQKSAPMTPETVRDKWSEIVDFTNARHPSTIQESTENFVSVLNKIDAGNAAESAALIPTNPAAPGLEKFIGLTFPAHKYHFTPRDVILYALGVGVSTREKDHLKFLFERSERFEALPTFSVVPAFAAFYELISSGALTSFNLDLTQLLHGEHYLKLAATAWPTDATVHSNVRISDVMDKGRGAVIVFDVETKTESGELLALNQFAAYVNGAGNYGGKRNSDKLLPICDPPTRQPDVTSDDVTSVDQAALYRLSGDYNPLHIDPDFAAMGGHATPILHGLCTYGFAARKVLQQYLNNESSRFQGIKVRFTKPVLPGQTIRTEMWKEGARIHIQCKVKETGEVCLAGGYVDIVDSSASKESTPAVQKPAAPATLTTEVVFQEMAERIKAKPSLCDSVNAIYQWNILRNGAVAEQWIVDLKNKPGSVYKGESQTQKPGCTLILEEQTFMDLIAGKVNPQKAFFSGKLKVQGNVMLSQKLSALLNDQAKL